MKQIQYLLILNKKISLASGVFRVMRLFYFRIQLDFFFTFHSDLPMLIFLKFRSRAWLRNDKLIDKKIRLCLSLMSGEIIIHKLIIEFLMRYE